MATINASTLNDVQYSGDCPLANAHGTVELSSAQIGDKVRLLKLYAGTKVFDVHTIFDDLGTGVTLDIGFEHVNGEAGGTADYWQNDLDVATAAGDSHSKSVPKLLNYDAYIIATVAGGAATGTLDVIVQYQFLGK